MTSSALLNDVGRMSSWLLAISVGVALLGLGGVNLVFLMVSPKFNPDFLVLSNPISYSLSESLSSLQHFLDLWDAFLRYFSSLTNFLHQREKNCLAGLGFLPAYLAVRKPAFTIPSFSYLWQSLVAYLVCTPPCFLHSLQDFSKWTFLGTGPFGSCLALLRIFLARFRDRKK